jgi:glycosyltransferase involved in cell wall biosynthesis
VIAISSYLENYFNGRGCNTLRIPPLIDIDEFPEPDLDLTESGGGTFRILFAGSPHRERWDVILAALVEARKRGAYVRLEILGTDREKWRSIVGARDELLDGVEAFVHFHGRVPKEAVVGVMAHSDAAIIVRDEARWSAACFPMKVPELLALGIPLIGTPTGDMSRYLKNGRNALLISKPDVSELSNRLVDAWNLSREERWKLREAARGSARAFDYRNHVKVLVDFVNHAREKARG